MRRVITLFLGSLELAVAGVLVYLGLQLPTAADVDQGFRRAENVTRRSGTQMQVLRRQVEDLRRPEWQQLANRLQTQTRAVAATLKTQQVDFDTVRTLRDALGEVAGGLTGLADTLDPAAVGKLGDGLATTATFLEDKLVPAADEAAEHLDQSTAALKEDAKRLQALLRDAPLDLKAAREIHDSLAKFGEGLDRMNKSLDVKRLEVMKDGFAGMEESLSTGADQVARLARYTYPAVRINGLKVEVDQKQFWPEGDTIAGGMRKGAKAVKEAGKEMETLAKELPEFRTSLAESRKVVDKTREALALALKQQDKVEPLLKDAPAHAARLAEELPKLGDDLSRILRDTKRLKEVGTALRQAQKGIEEAVGRWPEIRTTLNRLATLLKATRDQLDMALTNRREYEAAMHQTVLLADTFAAMLPLATDQLDARLDEEERSLASLEKGLDEVSDALPVYAQTASRLVQAGRLLAWLAALVVALHGGYLLGAGSVRRKAG